MDRSMTTEKVSNHIPEDLALSILSKLPLKSLKRFGCINKSYSLLFQNPNFMTVYHNNFISNDRCHSYYDDTSIFLYQELISDEEYRCSLHSVSGKSFQNILKLKLPAPCHEEFRSFHVLGSGHFIGILCLYRFATLVVWDPTTDQSHVIPPSSIESVPGYQGAIVRFNGFGYDHVRDDYKIIRYIHFYPVPLWEIYSLRCNSWKKLDVNMPTCTLGPDPGERLYLDGICHWWSKYEEYHYYNEENCLVSFDLISDKVFTTPVPLAMLTDLDANFDMDLVSIHLVILNGSIALISWFHTSMESFDDETTFHISILGELGVTESWTKLFIVPLPYIDNPIGAWKNGNIFFRNNNCELVCVDLGTQIIEELGVKGASIDNILLCKKKLVSIGAI